MKKIMYAIPRPFINAQTRRQQILDFLDVHPGAMLNVIKAHLDSLGNDKSIDGTLRSMIGFSEIVREGGHGQGQYYALATTTRSAVQVLLERERKMKSGLGEFNDHSKLQKHRPGVHLMGKHPIPNQGGQGALRRDTFASCSQNY